MKHLIESIIICLLLLAAIICNSQTTIVFNTKDNSKGHYYITIENDSMTLMEIIEYNDRHYINRMQVDYTYRITSTYKGQMYFDIYTELGMWTFFYCEEDVVCEAYFKSIDGVTNHYERLLNNN